MGSTVLERLRARFWLCAHSAVRANQVPEFKFTSAFENTLLIAPASGERAAIDPNAIRTISSAYSVRSCPASSFHSLARIVLMFVPFGECPQKIQTKNSRRKLEVFPTALSPPSPATRRTSGDDYVEEPFRFVAALVKTLLIAPASGPRAAIDPNAIRTNSRAYSVRSCPSSSFQSRTSTVFIFLCLS